MTKPLSELLQELKSPLKYAWQPEKQAKVLTIAVELAKACEVVSANGRAICLQLNEKDLMDFNKGNVQFLVSSLEIMADKGITKARSILEGGE